MDGQSKYHWLWETQTSGQVLGTVGESLLDGAQGSVPSLSFLLKHTGRQQGSLPLMWETWTGFWVPDFDLTQLCPSWVVEERTRGYGVCFLSLIPLFK